MPTYWMSCVPATPVFTAMPKDFSDASIPFPAHQLMMSSTHPSTAFSSMTAAYLLMSSNAWNETTRKTVTGRNAL